VTRPIVLAGGGTGGHVFVAEAVASSLESAGVDKSELWFVGSSRGQERTLLAHKGVTLTLLPGRGVQRSLAPSAIVKNLSALLGLGVAIIAMVFRFRRTRPRVVVSVGGYAALPAGLAGVLWRVPLVLVNIDAIPGATHRFLDRFASAACVIAPSTPLRHQVVTGAPIRPELEEVDRRDEARRAAKERVGVAPDRPLVVVVTGSLGARSVNAATAALVEAWRGRAVSVIHITGARDYAEIKAKAPFKGIALDYTILEFATAMEQYYQACDVLVARAGALTVAEIGSVGVASILVPLPGAPNDHQTKNAQRLVDAGAADMVLDADLSATTLGSALEALLDDAARRESMEAAARSLGHRHAAHEVAKVILSYG
jgi:UDP-N-acetylglucosamine--N-acetylmuramyl-(pentapeptide) pyrophosphoryl-undecaprenol N-acetylglucosamine transferase